MPSSYAAKLLDLGGAVAWEGEVRADRWRGNIPPRSVRVAYLQDPPRPVLSEETTYAEVAALGIGYKDYVWERETDRGVQVYRLVSDA